MSKPPAKPKQDTFGSIKVELWPLEKIKPYPGNPRKRSKKAVAKVEASIKEFGWRQPIVVDEKGVILAGHTRRDAAELLELKQAPVHQALGLSAAQKRAFRIADNRTNEETEWDDDLLAVELKGLEGLDFDLSLTGFDLRQVGSYTRSGPVDGEDDVPPVPKKPVTKRGELWLLGEHRLLCGDSTSAEDVGRLMDGQRAGLMNTDPPYLVDYDGLNHPSKWGQDRATKNKDWSESYGVKWNETGQDLALWVGAFGTAGNALTDNAAWYVWHADRLSAELRGVLIAAGLLCHQVLVWRKNRPVLTRSWFMQAHEACIFGWKQGHKPPLLGKEQSTTVWDLAHDESKIGSVHPTQKPVELFRIPVRIHTEENGIAYEPFSGSGSQLIACETENRRCFGLEIEPAYCDVIIARWEKFTGKKAKRA